MEHQPSYTDNGALPSELRLLYNMTEFCPTNYAGQGTEPLFLFETYDLPIESAR